MTKDWDQYVDHAELIARSDGFQHLRDRIIELAAPQVHDVVVDVGAGTGLLSLDLAPCVEEVWAIDIAPAMVEYLRTKAASARLDNLRSAAGSATSLPLVDASADLVVSNYCFHHLDDEAKLRALREVHRILRPGGRLAFGDMMFTLKLADTRDRAVVGDKVRAMLRRGPAGVLRLAKNGARIAIGTWEQPARAAWWRSALEDVGFTDVTVDLLAHEGGLAFGRRPPG